MAPLPPYNGFPSCEDQLAVSITFVYF